MYWCQKKIKKKYTSCWAPDSGRCVTPGLRTHICHQQFAFDVTYCFWGYSGKKKRLISCPSFFFFFFKLLCMLCGIEVFFFWVFYLFMFFFYYRCDGMSIWWLSWSDAWLYICNIFVRGSNYVSGVWRTSWIYLRTSSFCTQLVKCAQWQKSSSTNNFWVSLASLSEVMFFSQSFVVYLVRFGLLLCSL